MKSKLFAELVLLFLALGPALARKKLPSSFKESLYYPMDLMRYCEENHGGRAVRDGTHAFNWKCRRVGESEEFNIDSGLVCEQQYGSEYSWALLGANARDWACVDWREADNHVVPIVIISSDYFWDHRTIDKGVKSSAYALERVRKWYADAMDNGKTFSMVRPIVHLSLISSEEWNNLSCKTAEPKDRPEECDMSSSVDRGALLYEALDEASKTTLPDDNVVAPIFVYTGPDAQPFWLGAAALGKKSVQPPNVATCSSSSKSCGLYSIGHEIGHNFGLEHTCDVEPDNDNCWDSIMQNPSDITEAILTDDEQNELNDSRFFN